LVSSLTRDLAQITGPAHVLSDAGLLAGYLTDWTRRYHGVAACVVRPGSPGEVAAVVRYCARHSVPLVPQGGNTGLVGGSVPAPAPPPGASLPVLLSTTRLTTLGPVDPVARQVTAGAGVTIGQLRAHAAAAALEYGVDLASRESATVGGTIATNAGGIRMIRYGKTRAQLAGLTAVLPDGSLTGDLAGLTAGTAGYDLTQLLAGSEGTLAVITAARLRLWPVTPPGVVLLAGVTGIAEAAALQERLAAAGPGLLAAEYVEASGLALVRRENGLPPPLQAEHPGYLLAELPGPADPVDWLASVGLPEDTAVAADVRGRAALWAYRERLTEAISATGVPHKIDVAVPLPELGPFRAGLDQAVAAVAGPVAEVLVFGHVGVGNLHVNVLGLGPEGQAADEAVARLAVAHGGSAAAEHGIGRAKAGWLAWSRPPGEAVALRAIKQAFDPSGLLNPGVLFPRNGTAP
jgi:FAD/FMN-containing dehydrogenase